AFPNANQAYLSQAIYRLMKKPEIKQQIEEALQRRQRETEDRIIEEYYAAMLEVAKKRILLARIISGEMTFPKPYKTKDGIETVRVPANPSEIFRAIEIDNKLAKELGNNLPDSGNLTIYIGDEKFT
ncbi:MAG: hypothetical protein K0R82_3002, partial [Flavipsychrobacter sp.]|nr:hypothetical protein [Flavipsychrobacter sp.]